MAGLEPASEGQVVAFAQVSVYISQGGGLWADPIPAIGGSMLIEMEQRGLHTSDEAYKMAVTDALGTALKFLGVAADVYRGHFDGKYTPPATAQAKPANTPPPAALEVAYSKINELAKFIAEASDTTAAAAVKAASAFTTKEGEERFFTDPSKVTREGWLKATYGRLKKRAVELGYTEGK